MTQLAPIHQNVIQGQHTFIECNVSGSPNPIVLWSKPNGLLTNRHEVKGNRLYMSNVTKEDSGTYVCTAENKFGKYSSTAVLMVESMFLLYIILP